MPTPNGVNYLLQFLIDFFQFPNCPKQESKVDVQSYVLISLSVHWHICFMITQLFGKIRTRRNPCANLRKVFDFKYFLLVFQQKIFRIVCRFKKMPIFASTNPARFPKNSVPSGTFFVYRHEIYQTSNDAGTADSDTARQRSDDC